MSWSNGWAGERNCKSSNSMSSGDYGGFLLGVRWSLMTKGCKSMSPWGHLFQQAESIPSLTRCLPVTTSLHNHFCHPRPTKWRPQYPSVPGSLFQKSLVHKSPVWHLFLLSETIKGNKIKPKKPSFYACNTLLCLQLGLVFWYFSLYSPLRTTN